MATETLSRERVLEIIEECGGDKEHLLSILIEIQRECRRNYINEASARVVAEKLDIPFYDKELISMAADDINIAEEAFQNYDEHIVIHDPLDRQYYHAFSDIYKVPMSDQIFVAQSNVIRRLAAHGPCVIVGRCADMILDDSINLFIYSKMRDRIKRMLILEPGSDEKEMERRIREVDRKRKEYYQYYTGNTWGRAQNYHLCLDSGLTGVDGCLRAVLAYLGELSE